MDEFCRFYSRAHFISTSPIKTLLDEVSSTPIERQRQVDQEKKKKVNMYQRIKIVQHQAFKLDCYMTAECKTDPKRDGQSKWSAQRLKAPRSTTVPFPGRRPRA